MEDADSRETSRHDILRCLPPVNDVLGHELLAESRDHRGREAVVRAVRSALEEARASLKRGETPAPAVDASVLARRAQAILQAAVPGLRPVINATGILLHTGLGRAPLAAPAVAAVALAARGYCNLEFTLDAGARGRRAAGVSELLCELTGAAAATVVNNNAGATVLALRALAAGREVIFSLGQLVEIGGSFRLPEIFEVSGARLHEVGTTNKTRLPDYERAIGPNTAALLRVHHSNYRIVGFTEEPPLEPLARLAHSRGLWMIDDIGSGALAPGRPSGVSGEPTAAEGLAAGADLVLFSGDKLLGGPQCGILVGSTEVVRRLEADPLMRALRVDKMTLAALEATLGLIRDGAGAVAIPLWKMLNVSLADLEARAGRFAETLRREQSLNAEAVRSESFIGGGSVPVQPLPTWAVSVEPPFPPPCATEGAWAQALRIGAPPVVPRVRRGAVLFDLRTVAQEEEASLLDAIARTWHDRSRAAGADAGPGS